MDLSFVDATALEQLCASLTRLDRPVLLERVPADSLTVTALGRAFRWPAMLVRRWARPYPVVMLDPSWLEPESHLNPRRRSDLRRARRRAEDLGPVRFDLAAVTPEQLPRRLEQGLQVEAAGWKRQEGTAMLVDPAAGRFFTSYAAEACRQGSLLLNLMYVDEQPVAMQLAVEVGRRLWLLKIGYDESFARCSPGNLLLLETLRDSAARGLHSVEFLGRCEPWTEPWTTQEQRCVSLLAYPGTLRGLSSLARDGASYAFNSLRRRFG
jgi:CelD/BcsL family acetyltransferase involved in cellulose biosynthesis